MKGFLAPPRYRTASFSLLATVFLVVLALPSRDRSAAVAAFSSSVRGGFGKEASSSGKQQQQEQQQQQQQQEQTQRFDLGQNKYVRLYVPPDALNQQLSSRNSRSKKSKKKKKEVANDRSLAPTMPTADLMMKQF